MSEPRASACLEFLRGYEAKYAMPPTVRGIMVGMGLKSTSQATRLLNQLVAHGHIKIARGKIRGIQILDRICPNCGHHLSSTAGSKTAIEAPGDPISPPVQPVAGGIS